MELRKNVSTIDKRSLLAGQHYSDLSIFRPFTARKRSSVFLHPMFSLLLFHAVSIFSASSPGCMREAVPRNVQLLNDGKLFAHRILDVLCESLIRRRVPDFLWSKLLCISEMLISGVFLIPTSAIAHVRTLKSCLQLFLRQKAFCGSVRAIGLIRPNECCECCILLRATCYRMGAVLTVEQTLPSFKNLLIGKGS